jgi:hypothetical protein
MARALINAPAAKARMLARTRLDKFAYRPITAPTMDDDVVNRPTRMTASNSVSFSMGSHQMDEQI